VFIQQQESYLACTHLTLLIIIITKLIQKLNDVNNFYIPKCRIVNHFYKKCNHLTLTKVTSTSHITYTMHVYKAQCKQVMTGIINYDKN